MANGGGRQEKVFDKLPKQSGGRTGKRTHNWIFCLFYLLTQEKPPAYSRRFAL